MLPYTTFGLIVNETGYVRRTDQPIQEEGRVALEGGNPELPPAERETNRDWILREIKDLEAAIKAVRKALT